VNWIASAILTLTNMAAVSFKLYAGDLAKTPAAVRSYHFPFHFWFFIDQFLFYFNNEA
jgi:hypothetical protein